MSAVARRAARLTSRSPSLRAIASGPSSMSNNVNAQAAQRLATVTRHLSASSVTMKSSGSSSQSNLVPKHSSPDDPVLYESNLSARIYKLNRPKQRNALNHDMIISLRDKIGTWRDSDLCKILIGTGDPVAFCAGGDVKQLIVNKKNGKDDSLAFFKDEFELNWTLGRLGKPYVAVMDGLTMGGGAGLALPAPIRIATSGTIFAMPETKIGYAPDVGAQYYLAQLDGNIGAWLAVTGQEVFGRANYELGLSTHYVSPHSIPDVIFQISQLPFPTLRNISALIANYLPPPPSSSDLKATSSKATPEAPTAITGDIRKFLDKAFEKKSIQEVYEALEGAEVQEGLSDEVKSWAKVQKGMMEERSPTGMAVALESYKRAKKTMKLDRALLDDISMATGFSGTNPVTKDFINGVTSLLINKPKTAAVWDPSSITSPSLSPKTITQNFFSTDTEGRSTSSTHLTDLPSLHFNPAPSSSKSARHDTTWGKFRLFGLPSEAEVKSIVEGSSAGSGAFKLKEQEILDGKLAELVGLSEVGFRKEEVEQRVKEIIERYCEVDGEGYLSWRLK